MKTRNMLSLLAVVASASATGAFAADDAAIDAVARGRYLVAVAGCNDCHTDGYIQNDGRIPEAKWLEGSAVGFSGPWGVSYPSNLRLVAAGLDEDGWKARVRKGGLPPMPWPSLRAMSDADLVAVHRYLRALGPGGVPAPQALAPGQPITTPHFVFVPQPPDRITTSAR